MFTRTQQQDAQEFLIFVVNRLSELIKEAEGESEKTKGGAPNARAGGGGGGAAGSTAGADEKNPPKQTWVEEIFEGRLRTETRCLCCESVQTRDEAFINLSVPITQNTSITGASDNHC